MNYLKNVGSVVTACATLILMSNPTLAASISWKLGQNFNNANGYQAFDTTGSLVEAINLSPSSTGLLTVDPSGLNITFKPGDKLNQVFFNSGSPGSIDGAWNNIINVTDWNDTNVTINNFLTNLTVGRKYQIQLFASDSRSCCSMRTQFFHDGLGNQSPIFTQGSFTSIIGTFIADDTNQTLGLTASSNNPILNAYVLRDITNNTPISVNESSPCLALILLGIIRVIWADKQARK